jgi:hypothetical protein
MLKTIGMPKSFDESKTAKTYKHLVPMIYKELKPFRYGDKDIKNFFSSQQGRFLTNRIVAIYRDSIVPDKEKEDNIKRTVKNAYINYRLTQRQIPI